VTNLAISPTSGENHDWDLTLRAAYELLQVGLALHERKSSGSLSVGFAHFTGSMVLSYAAIESYSASTAFCMSRHPNYADFEFDLYRRSFRFKDKIERIYDAAGRQIDWSQGLFQKIKGMQDWRNLVVHSSPYAFSETDATAAAKSSKRGGKTYAGDAGPIFARDFFDTAEKYIEGLEELTGLKPTTHVVFAAKESP
jgi:hypothetical protein